MQDAITDSIDMALMLRKTDLILLSCAAAGASPAHATEEDTQYRISASVSKSLSRTVDATINISQRYRSGADQTLMRASVDKELSSHLSIGGGIAYSESAGVSEIRPHQQLDLRFGVISLRTRMEQRFFENLPRTEIRLRQRLQASLPVGKRTRAVVGTELIYVARSRDQGEKSRVSGLRASLEIRHTISARAEARIGYLHSRSLRKGIPDDVTHSPQLGIALRY